MNSTLCEEDSSSDESIEDEQLAEAEDIMVQAIENFIDEDSFGSRSRQINLRT